MTDHIDWDRLARYVSGESAASERADVERWAAGSAANREALDSARRRWSAAGDGTTWNVDAAWKRLAPRLNEVTPEPGVVPLRTAVSRARWQWVARALPLAAAAVFLIAVALRFGGDKGVPASGTTTLAAETRTGIGEQRAIELPDGSQVLLGAASSLRVADGFGSGGREVHLEGQAFLRVRHDADRPFVVNAGGTRAVDLGTAFEVRAYPNEGVRVAVTEGKVEVRRTTAASDSAVLQPGDVAELPVSGSTIVKRQQDVERLLAWTRGQLVFDDAPLGDVARTLERWFDVEVRIEDESLRDLHYSAQLRIGESLDSILELMELSLSSRGVRAERNGRVVTFRAGTPSTRSALPGGARGRVEAGA